MKKILFLFIFAALLAGCNSSKEKTITFYKVPLVCEMDKEIGWGSRAKPLFIETAKREEIKESWMNRQGTFIAILWKENIAEEDKKKIMNTLFGQFEIKAEYISDNETQGRISESFYSNVAPAQKKDQWFKGMDVDQLSMEEARAIGDTATLFALKAELINEAESLLIKKEIIEYMKTELVKVRSYEELSSDETDLIWKKNGYEIYIKHIGVERAEKVRDLYIDYRKKMLDHSRNSSNGMQENS